MARKPILILVVASALWGLEARAQDDAATDFYIAEGRRIALPESERSRALRISAGRMEEFRAAVEGNSAVALVPMPDVEERYGVAFLSAAEDVDVERFRAAAAALETHPAVESRFPVYRVDDLEVVLVNEFIVRFESDVPLETGRAVLERLGAEVVDTDERRLRFTVSFPAEPPDVALRRVNELAADPRVRYAQPAFVRVLAPRVGVFDDVRLPPAAELAPALARAPEAAAALESGNGTQTPAGPFPACPSGPNDPTWTGPPDDALFGQQWSLRNASVSASEGTAGADINAVAGWQTTQGSADVTIAVLDLGVYSGHPDLQDKMVTGEDITGAGTTEPLPNDEHGTAIAGVAAADSDDGLGIAGVDWHARIAPIRIAKAGCPLGDCKWGMLPQAPAEGVLAAIDLGARVLINSWGWHADLPDDDLNAALGEAVDANAVVVLAAGQHQPALDPDLATCTGEEDRSVFYPARLAGDADETLAGGLIAVSATNQWDEFQVHQCENWQANGAGGWGSNRGPEVSLSAPGSRILSPTNDGSYKCFSGTSMAAPLVAGAAALLLAVYPDATPAEIKHWLQEGADYFGGSPTGRDDRYGHGRLDIAGALDAAAADRAPAPNPAEGVPAPPRGLHVLRVGLWLAILALGAAVLAWRLLIKRAG